jgi:heat shock protein HslJ
MPGDTTGPSSAAETSAGAATAVVVGEVWTLDSVVAPNVDAAFAEAHGRLPRVTFSSDGVVTGSDGCNGFGGTYVLHGERLTVGQLASSDMACESTLTSLFDAAFDDAERTVVADGRLVAHAGPAVLTFAADGGPTGGALLDIRWVLADVELGDIETLVAETGTAPTLVVVGGDGYDEGGGERYRGRAGCIDYRWDPVEHNGNPTVGWRLTTDEDGCDDPAAQDLGTAFANVLRTPEIGVVAGVLIVEGRGGAVLSFSR